MTREELETLKDRLYVLACVLEDVARDVSAGDEEDRQRSFDALVEAAKNAVSS